MGQGSKHRAGIAIGVTLVVVSVVGAFCGYWLGMARAHATLGAPALSGSARADALHGDINFVLYSLIAAGIGTLAGIVILVRALLAWQRASRPRGGGD